MHTSPAAAPRPNPILDALRAELSSAPPQRAATVFARWFSDLTIAADLRDEVAAPIRRALRVLRLLLLRYA